MKACPLWPFIPWMSLSVVATAGLSSAPVGYAAPALIAQARTTNGSNNESDVKAMAEEAENLRSQGDFASAAAIWRQLVAYAEKAFGTDHRNVALSLNNLAGLLSAQGQYNAAEILYRRSLAIHEKAGEQNQLDIARSLNNLATSLSNQGKHEEAELLYQRALIIREKRLGPDHLDVAQSLNNLAMHLQDKGQHTAAEPHIRRALVIYENVLGPNHHDVALSLNNLAQILSSSGRYTEAEPLYRRSLTILEKALGPNHPDVAVSLSSLASLLKEQGRYATAEALYRRSLAIREKALGPNHPDVAISLSSLASLLKEQGQYTTAETLYRRSIIIQETTLGLDHPDVAASLNNLAELLRNQGHYESAEGMIRRSLSIIEKGSTENQAYIATIVNSLAMLLLDQGKFTAAETLMRRSLAIKEKIYGPNHPAVATSLNNLAEILKDQSQYTAAETLARRSLTIREKAFGANHPDVALSLDNLAMLLTAQGQQAEAERLSRRSLNIREKSFRPNHPAITSSLKNLARLLTAQGQHAASEALYRRILTIEQRAFGANSPIVATSLNNLALTLLAQDKYDEAGALFRRALAIYEKTLGADHPNIARILNNLALLLDAQGKHATAGTLFLRSFNILEKSFPSEHPAISQSLRNISISYLDRGRHQESLSALHRSLAGELAWLIRELSLLPERSRSAQLKQLGPTREFSFGLIGNYPPAAQLALETRLNRQGLLPEIEQRQALLLNAPGLDSSKVEQLQALTQKLASVTLPAERRSAVREQRDQLQAELYRQFPDLQIQIVTPSAVAQALPTDGVLVEFQRFHPYDGRKPREQRWGAAEYIALVLKPNGSIRAVPLGPAPAIDAMVRKGLRSTAESLSDADVLWAQLSDQVLRPLLPHLNGSRQWFLSPDGELNRVPFAALPAPQQPSTPLAAAVQLRLLTTGRELIRLQQPAASAGAAVVMANPSYDRHGGRAVAATQSDAAAALAQRRSADLASNRWLPLPGTEREGQQVASLLGTHLISGSGATTMALQQQQGPRVLHVATHGFFVADQESSPSDPLRTIQEQAPQLRAFRGEEPLLRSGLVLAGANQPDLDPKDDGYLTASEALMLKLKGTELVVLSACSTAQGDIRTGEGVYGLQRALTVAGARSTLLSLWKVDDAATAEFMARFYRRLKAGEGRADALATVQQEFRDGKTGNNTWREPAYWAAWQLVGDWRPIQGL